MGVSFRQGNEERGQQFKGPLRRRQLASLLARPDADVEELVWYYEQGDQALGMRGIDPIAQSMAPHGAAADYPDHIAAARWQVAIRAALRELTGAEQAALEAAYTPRDHQDPQRSSTWGRALGVMVRAEHAAAEQRQKLGGAAAAMVESQKRARVALRHAGALAAGVDRFRALHPSGAARLRVCSELTVGARLVLAFFDLHDARTREAAARETLRSNKEAAKDIERRASKLFERAQRRYLEVRMVHEYEAAASVKASRAAGRARSEALLEELRGRRPSARSAAAAQLAAMVSDLLEVQS